TAPSKPNTSPQPSTIVTPLPSYTSSPVLRTTPATTPLTPLKLSPPLTTTTPEANHTIAHRFASPLIAVLATNVVDTLYLTLLNFAGILLTLIQLPLAVLLAAEFNGWLPLGGGKVKQGMGGKGVKAREGWMMLFTQIMWDCHDFLEEAELELPSHWAR
ncbi:hypothetical protein, partial [Sporisorium scitamineum]